MAVEPVTSGCCIYPQKVKQVAGSLCEARYENGPNSILSYNKPFMFEV